jgi:RimJ/RimL family protein N-acetyltransferase
MLLSRQTIGRGACWQALAEQHFLSKATRTWRSGFGYATEAVAALISWIFRYPHVRSIHAQTFPHLHPSLRVLAKNGFEPAGTGFEEGTVLLRKWRN